MLRITVDRFHYDVVAQLISVRDGFHLWAQSYDRAVGEPLEIKRELARLIADDLKALLFPTDSWNRVGQTTPNSEASKEYLEGYRLFKMEEVRSEWTSGLPPKMQAAIDAFSHATEKDPDFAAAWAALGEACEWAATLTEQGRPTLRSRAEAAAKRAPQLEPTNDFALLALANIYLFSRLEPPPGRTVFAEGRRNQPAQRGYTSGLRPSFGRIGQAKRSN